jgi:membrane-bound metal-dependent hydrolase YbcI (DUF457 family)
MDPVTHLIASYTLARSTRARLASPQMAVVLVAGLAPDLDWLWHLPAPLAPMRAYGTATHSLAGAGVLAAAVAAAVWFVIRRTAPADADLPAVAGVRSETARPRLSSLLAAALAAAGLHLLLDAAANAGIEPWWPFATTRVAWNLTPAFDSVAILLLLFFALLPLLILMIKEEIGVAVDPLPSRIWPLAALALLGAWLGARAELHHRAEHMLADARYMSSGPLHWGAFPSGSSPFRWHGIWETDSFLAETEMTLGTQEPFTLDNAVIHYKPEPSAAVDAASAAPLSRAYVALARFPLLSIEAQPDGIHAQLSDLGSSLLHTHSGTWSVLIDLDAQPRVTREVLFYIPAKTY